MRRVVVVLLFLFSLVIGLILTAETPGVCQLSLSRTTCLHGGCGGGPLECTATTSTVGDQHMCTRAADCTGTKRCCSVCGGGLAISLCMSSADATMYGAKCL